MDTQILKHGEPARLFPVLPDAQKERKTLSIFLAAITSVRPFAERILSIVEQRLGKRAELSCFTEVTLTNEIKGLKDRPDALISFGSGKRSWSALIEAKVGRNRVEDDQLARYLQLAKANGVDAVITITNQLTPTPRLHPTYPSRSVPKNVELFHISWSAIFTQAFLLASDKDDPYENDDEAFIISEFIRYLEHSASGLVPLDQMNKDWPQLVKSVQSGHPPNPKAPEVSEMITTWHQEARDVALIMTRKLREPVTISVSRTFMADHAAWVDSEIKQFCAKNVLSFDLDVPNAAGRINVEADFLRRSVRVAIRTNAPRDKARNSARLNWLLRQLKKADLSSISILCITKGRGANFGAMANEIDQTSDEFLALGEIIAFNIEMSSDLSAKFNSRKKFVEELELLVPRFYANVGQHLKAWTPSPPKVDKKVVEASAEDVVEKPEKVDSLTPEAHRGAKPPAATSIPARPAWARQWSAESSIGESASVPVRSSDN